MSFLALKNEGNDLLKAGKLEEAVECYAAAAAACGKLEEGTREDDDNRAVALSNRSLALLKLGRPQEAHDDAEAAVESNPEYAKARQRLGKALEALGRDDEAQKCFTIASKLQEFEKAARAAGDARL